MAPDRKKKRNPLAARRSIDATNSREARISPLSEAEQGGGTNLQPSNEDRSDDTSAYLLRPDSGPELFFGLVGPVGTDLELVIDVLAERLKLVNYASKIVHLSRLLDSVPGLVRSQPSKLDEYYKVYMDAGNDFRKAFGRNDALALLSILKIRSERRAITGNPAVPASRCAYILRSLKHQDEVDALRKIYGRAFFLIGAYSPRSTRIENLSKRIAGSYHDTSKIKYRSHAERILTRDEHEEELEGQHVRNVFPKSDIFVDATSRQSILAAVSRFIDLVFSSPFITPSHDEFSMYLARAAAFRSADLSRQVGAVITTVDSDVIGVGCNEVPKAFGGQYWENDQHDHRDWRLGYDPSSKMKREVLAETIQRLFDAKWFAEEKEILGVNALVKIAEQKDLQGSQILDIIEYGRIVHAEMAAIIDAAQMRK